MIEQKAPAIERAVKTLCYYLWVAPFTAETDHTPLVWLSCMKASNLRLMYWYLFLHIHSPLNTAKTCSMLTEFFMTICTRIPGRVDLLGGGGGGMCDPVYPGGLKSQCQGVTSFVCFYCHQLGTASSLLCYIRKGAAPPPKKEFLGLWN